MTKGPRPETRAAQGAADPDPSTGALVPAIHPSAPFVRDEHGDYLGGRSYSRDQNPSGEPAEELLRELEGGADALLFSSGMAAGTTLLEGIEPGAHVVAPRDMYFTMRRWLESLAKQGRIDLEFVPTCDLAALSRAMRKGTTGLVWLESPTNPTCGITDLAAAAEIAHAAGALVVADGTTATPVLTRSLERGCDLVLHSATKQLNGHSDVLAGALVCAREDAVWERVRHERGQRGAVLGPFEAWLLQRGMRTLFLRVRASSASALELARYLESHGGVEEVFYPGLPSHPGHEIARSQMQGGFGALVSFRPAGGEAGARRVLKRLRVFRDASSLGGVESLVEHRARVEGAESEVARDLLRLSIGIEASEDLLADLEEAL